MEPSILPPFPGTLKVFLQDTYLFKISDCVLRQIIPNEKDPLDLNLIFDKTIFHPQGGGQPSDIGEIIYENVRFPVVEISYDKEKENILHRIRVSNPEDLKCFQINNKFSQEVDEKKRRTHAKLHSAGHLLDVCVRDLGIEWSPGKGFHFEESPYVEYAGKMPTDEKLKEILTEKCNYFINNIEEKNISEAKIYNFEEATKIMKEVPEYLPKNKPIRYVKLFDKDDGCPCGGTHVKHVKDIGGMKIVKIAKKGKNVRTQMNKESKETIKTVFENFDKDKSNYIDIKEIGQVAKELGDEISEQELQRIFADLDINKDGRISFEEFWDWWTYGRANKLERLVFLKLKAMNLLKKAHANFVRYGASLESKFDKSLDHHYIALNMGVPVPESSISFKAHLRGEEPAVFQSLIKGLNLSEEFIGVFLRFESPNPEEAKTELERVLAIVKEKGAQTAPELESLLPFFTFHTGIDQNCVVVALEIKHPFFLDILENYRQGFLEKVGQDFTVKFLADFGLKNSFKKLVENLQQKFVAFFFEGFIGEFKLSLNSSFLRTVRKAGLQFLLELGMKKNLTNWGVLLSLIQGSKFHLVFREVKDVNEFFSGMGVDVLLDSQPTSKEIIDEVKEDFSLPKLKQNAIFMAFINFCQKHVRAHVNLGVKIPEATISLQFDGVGVKELVNYMLSDSVKE